MGQRLRILTVVAAAAAGATTNTSHGASEWDFAGAGTQKCGAWIAQRRAPGGDESTQVADLVTVSWAQGFISSWILTNRAANRPAPKMPDPDTIRAYFDKHCRNNPLDDLLMATVALYGELKKVP